MSITTAIGTALSGLRATQAGIDLVSQNVANAGTAGYTRRVLTTVQELTGEKTTGVTVVGAQRVLDTLLQRQLRLENAGAGYTAVKASYHSSLDAMFDAPGGTGSLPTLLNSLSTAGQTLASNPAAYIARSGVVSAAEDVANSLNSLTGQVQTLRQSAEDALGLAVEKVNSLLKGIADVSARMRADPSNATSPGMLDQRDGLIDQLSELVDVQVTPRQNGVVSVSTTGGLQLYDGVNSISLSFDGHSPIGPDAVYDKDPAKRSVGTITATDAWGRSVDVLSTGMIRSGQISALIELRDEVLPEAQMQLDGLAAGLASALSDRDVAGAAVTAAGADGFSLDITGLQNGNPVTVAYTSGGVQRSITFVKASSAAGAAAATASGNGVIGIDFSGTAASVKAAIETAMGPGFTATLSGSSLQIVDDGAAGTTDVRGMSGRVTVTGTLSGGAELPLFKDGAGAYTGSYEGKYQLVGLAGRITVNADVKADPSLVVRSAAATPAGDPARPQHIVNALTERSVSFPGSAGIGGGSVAWSGTVSAFATQVVATQASNANSAANLDSGQKVVLNALQSRFSDYSGVNIDTEMAQLIQLQTAYGANARVMTAAKEMLDLLMRVGA